MLMLFTIYISGIIITILLTRYFNKKLDKRHKLYTPVEQLPLCLLSWVSFILCIWMIWKHVYRKYLKYIIKKWYE
jgi:hypothetical protein